MSFDQDHISTTLFAIPFTDFYCSSTGGAASADLWSLTCSTQGRTRIRAIHAGQKSTDVATNQQLSVQIMRGSTALGGGAEVYPANTKSWTYATTANAVAYAPASTALASTASADLIYADAMDQGAFRLSGDAGRYTLDGGQTLVVRVSAPPVGVYLSGTLVIEEVPAKAI
jgi:hypothetical protein